MKNLFKFVFVAAAAMALTFCSKDETVNPTQASGLRINVTAESATRTVFDDATHDVKWSGNEEMQFYANGTGSTVPATMRGDKAVFSCTTGIPADGQLKLQGIVPASAVSGFHNSDMKMSLKSEQTATVESFDPAADILVSEDYDCTVTPEQSEIDVEFKFGRVMAITCYDVVVNNRNDVSDDEVVESVKVELSDADGKAKKVLTGGFYFNLSDGRFVDNNGNPKDASTNPFYQNGGYNYVSIAYPEGSRPTLGELKIWTVTAPVTMEAGDKLVFTIKTDKNTITKTSTLKTPISLDATRLNTSTVKINETCKVDPVETPSPDMQTATLTPDDILAIGQSISGTGYQTMPPYTNAYGTWEGDQVSKQGNSAEKAAIGINTPSKGSYIKTPVLSGYIRKVELDLYQTSSNPVYLNTEASIANPVATGAVDAADNKKIVIDVDDTKDYNQLWIVGGFVNIHAITVYYTESTDPKITVADADKTQNIPAEGDVVSVPFTAKNLAGDVTASCEAAWVNSIEVSGSEVTFAVDATDLTTERTAVLKIESATDGVSAEVTLVQAAAAPVIEAIAPDEYAAEGEETAFFEYSIGGTGAVEGAEVTAEVVYGDGEATGWITVIEVDNTDKAVWFEVAANDGGARTAAIRLTYAKGETVYATEDVTISQAKSAAVVDPAVSVDPAEWAPAAAGETKTFAVTLTDTDSYDVAKPDWITIEEQTATSLKLTAAANTTDADRTGTVTLTVSNGKTATIAVSQEAPALGPKVGDIIWSEDWTGASAGTSYSTSYTVSANYGKGTYVYGDATLTYSQNTTNSYVYKGSPLAGGTEPELLLYGNKTPRDQWTISNIPTFGVKKMTLTYLSNNEKSSVTSSTSGVTVSGSSKSYTITIGENVTEFELKFSCSGNTRIDDVKLVVAE